MIEKKTILILEQEFNLANGLKSILEPRFCNSKISPVGPLRRNKLLRSGPTANLILEKELPIRQALGNLRSSMFKLEIRYDAQKQPEQFIFYGGGWGYGVGMCQSGAFGLAQAGKNYKDILRHYYQGAEFKAVY